MDIRKVKLFETMKNYDLTFAISYWRGFERILTVTKDFLIGETVIINDQRYKLSGINGVYLILKNESGTVESPLYCIYGNQSEDCIELAFEFEHGIIELSIDR